MALLWSIAVVMCEFLARLQTARINRGLAPEVQSSGHSEVADMTPVAYDENLLACEGRVSHGGPPQKTRSIIQGKDKPLVDYFHAMHDFTKKHKDKPLVDYPPSTINCKPFTPRPKPSSMLKNVTIHTLPEDMIGLIGSFNHDMQCDCQIIGFNMTCLEKCRVALTQNQFVRVHEELKGEGGSCDVSVISEKSQTLQACMTSPQASQIAWCRLDSDERNQLIIKQREGEIKENEDTVQASQELVKQKIQEHQEDLKEAQEFVKNKQDRIKDLQDDLDMHKQNNVYVQQIFDGP